jgi:hypothetical protein
VSALSSRLNQGEKRNSHAKRKEFESTDRKRYPFGEPTIFFINKHGDFDAASLKEDAAEQEWGGLLAEQTTLASGGPYFEICSVGRGEDNRTVVFVGLTQQD